MLEVIAVVLSALALIVSVWAVVSSRSTAARQNESQDRLLALETARERDRLLEAQTASVHTRIVKTGRDYRLVVQNDGPAVAKHVKVLLDGGPLLQHSLVVRNETEVSKLGPGVTASYILAVTLQSEGTLDATITWEDQTGQPRSWESELKLL